MTRRFAVVGLLVVTLLGLVVAPAAGAASSVGTPTVTPASVETGATTPLSVAVTPLGVDTSDATTGSSEITSAAGQLTAVAAASDRSVTQAPATLYMGERNVDITGLTGSNPAGTSQQFYGTSGDAEGSVATTDDTRLVNVTEANGFATGAYNFTNSSGAVDIAVREPRVTGLSLYVGASTTGADVTNGSTPSGTERLTVEPSFTFDDAENVTITVEDEQGLDVTGQLATSPTVTTSGETLTLDVSGLDVGLYEVTAEGSDDLDAASTTRTFRLRPEEKSLSLSRTQVVSGDTTVASVAGAPGDVRYLRISGDDLREGALVNPATARDVFDRTGKVQSVSADSDANYLYAVVLLDDDGISEVRIRTDRLVTESVDVELAPEVDAEAEDDVTLDIDERGVTVDALDPTPIGETISVSGTAPQSDQVKLYAKVDDQYLPLYADATAGSLAEADVKSDGAWRVDIDTSTVVDLPAGYRIVAVGDPGATRLGSADALAADTLSTLEPRGSTTLTTTEGSLSLTTSRTSIAATGDDEFTLAGVATGQTDLRLYHIDPRGDVVASTVDTTAGTFEERIDGVERRGSHTYLVVASGRDGEYSYAPDGGPSVDSLLSGSETPDAARAKIVDAYTEAGSDDQLSRVTVTASDASVTVARPSADESISAEQLTVAGQSNSEDGTEVYVELLDGDRAVGFAEAPIRNGSWNATLDLAGLSPGTYQLSVETTTAETTRALTLTEEAAPTSTPGEMTPGETTPATGTTTAETTPTASATIEETVTATDATADESAATSTEFPGFGGLTTVAALVVALMLVSVRSR